MCVCVSARARRATTEQALCSVRRARPARTPLQQIGKYEAVALDHLTAFNRQRSRKHRAVVGEGMKFAVFAAGIDAGWELCQQGLIELPADEACRQLLGIDAGEARAQPAADHHLS